jgi:hypothetical protein
MKMKILTTNKLSGKKNILKNIIPELRSSVGKII